MLDLKFVRENHDLIKSMLRRRGMDLPLDQLIEYDAKRRSTMVEAQKLRHTVNVVSGEVAELKRRGEDAEEKIEEMRAIKDRILEAEVEMRDLEEKVMEILVRIPNVPHDSVPDGVDENDNVEVRRWGEMPRFDFKPKDHIDLGLDLGLIDVEKAGEVAGARFYYIKGDLVLLNYALMMYGLDFLREKGFVLVEPPYMLRRDVLAGAVYLSDFEDVIYKIEGEDLYLIATSEHPLAGLHMDEILEGRKLPLRYSGISPCFRKEAGTHGRDTKGIFRVHQFNKVEQFIYSRPEDSWKEHELLIHNAEEIFQGLRIPYRIVNVCIGDLGAIAAKKYDLETWLPGQGRYREMVSCSNCTEYQARKLRIRFRDKPHEKTRFIHTLNSTAIATERTLISIMENYQQRDGTIRVPEILKPYMKGIEVIGEK